MFCPTPARQCLGRIGKERMGIQGTIIPLTEFYEPKKCNYPFPIFTVLFSDRVLPDLECDCKLGQFPAYLHLRAHIFGWVKSKIYFKM
jgi:hypothetical protein